MVFSSPKKGGETRKGRNEKKKIHRVLAKGKKTTLQGGDMHAIAEGETQWR